MSILDWWIEAFWLRMYFAGGLVLVYILADLLPTQTQVMK